MRTLFAPLFVCLVSAGLAQGADGTRVQAPESGTAAALSPTAGPAAELLSGTVSLKLSPTAHGPNILLGDLVAENLPPDVAAFAVKPAGGPGSWVDVDPALVALKLKRVSGGPYALGPHGGILRVEARSQKVSAELIRNFAADYLRNQLSGTAGVDIELQGGGLDLNLYDAPVRFRIHPPEDKALRGYLVLRVEVLQSDINGQESVVDTVPVNFLVHRREMRLFTTQPVHRGDIFGPDNLAVQEMDTTMVEDGFSDLGYVSGKVAKTFIPQGKPLSVAMVDLPLSIHEGDMVRLLIKSGAVVVETSAKAGRDAKVGDSLPLLVQDTGKQVQARCVDVDVAVQNAW
jgi:flagella basal body P-ring formation protein FlgA